MCVISLTTDFGSGDHFAGVMRGVILSINPQAVIVDLCNSVSSFDVLDGALTIAEGYHHFPSESIHLVVVDPGVGTPRRPILMTTMHYTFVAPDNGVLSLVMAQEEHFNVFHITADHYFRQPVSHTFHGRDIFAPCAGWLSKGLQPKKFGDEITDYVRFTMPQPKPINEHTLRGAVLKADKFGNLVTNFTVANTPALTTPNGNIKIKVGDSAVARLCDTYGEGKPGELIALFNSMGLLEIACNRTPATQVAKAGRGAAVTVEW